MKKIILFLGILLAAGNTRTMNDDDQQANLDLQAMLNAMMAEEAVETVSPNYFQIDPALSVTSINLSNKNIRNLDELNRILNAENIPKGVALIDLSNNSLEKIEPDLFKDFTELEYIRLQGNPIAETLKEGKPGDARWKLKTLEAQFRGSNSKSPVKILL